MHLVFAGNIAEAEELGRKEGWTAYKDYFYVACIVMMDGRSHFESHLLPSFHEREDADEMYKLILSRPEGYRIHWY